LNAARTAGTRPRQLLEKRLFSLTAFLRLTAHANGRPLYAFGIDDTITSDDLANRPSGVQAFVGWKGSPRAPDTDADWSDYGLMQGIFFEAWMDGYNLDDCLTFASDPSLSWPLGAKFNFFQSWLGWYSNNYSIRVYGYRGIKRTDYDDGY